MGFRYRRNNWEGGVQETRRAGTDRLVSQQTFTCAHHGGVVIVPLRAKPDEIGRFCTRCHRPVCSRKDCVEHCFPMEAQVAEIERKAKAEEARAQLLDAVSAG